MLSPHRFKTSDLAGAAVVIFGIYKAVELIGMEQDIWAASLLAVAVIVGLTLANPGSKNERK
jgi:hypothetical protein